MDNVNTWASIELLNRAMNEDNLSIADMLIASAHRLDKNVPVEELRVAARNNWLDREHAKRESIFSVT